MIHKLLIATRNAAKVKEYSLLLQSVPFPLTTLVDEGIRGEVEEIGYTLEENAKLKAMAYSRGNQFLVIADDSGLEVDALGGEPGSLSARYGGQGTTDHERITLVLSRLEGIPWERRSARFRCVIAIALNSKIIGLCEDECQGIITFEPKGTQGFGYDPIFYMPELDKTMAELSLKDKNQVSHRGKTARKAIQIVERLYQELN